MMFSRLPRCTVAALVTGVVLASVVSVAQAIPPTTEIFRDEGFITLPDFDCGSFTLHEEMISEDITVMTFYDQQGDVARQQIHIRFVGEITNSATGETFRDHAAVKLITKDDITTASGLSFNLVRRGQGAVMQLIGRRIEDSEGNVIAVLAGPDDIQGDLQTAICVALA
jgi:hypothetical protein